MRKTTVETSVGKLVPFYEISDGRQKNRPSVEYYKSGALYSVYLQEQTKVHTPVGDMPAELVTFYESGNVKRVFPLYGQLSGFWTEEQEYELAKPMTFIIQGKEVSVKPLCIHFYESGKICSITIWSKERMTVHTLYGDITTDLGIEFYETGEIRSVEPVIGTKLVLPDRGVVYPFNFFRLRMHADNNTLKFDKTGHLTEIKKNL